MLVIQFCYLSADQSQNQMHEAMMLFESLVNGDWFKTKPIILFLNNFAERFRGINRTADREIYIHYTNATDTTLLKATMQSVQDMIIQKNLNNLIL